LVHGFTNEYFGSAQPRFTFQIIGTLRRGQTRICADIANSQDAGIFEISCRLPSATRAIASARPFPIPWPGKSTLLAHLSIKSPACFLVLTAGRLIAYSRFGLPPGDIKAKHCAALSRSGVMPATKGPPFIPFFHPMHTMSSSTFSATRNKSSSQPSRRLPNSSVNPLNEAQAGAANEARFAALLYHLERF
jgi:hypothetical protein